MGDYEISGVNRRRTWKGGGEAMLKWPRWVRIVLGAAAVLLCAALALLLGPHLGDSWPFLLLPGAIIFACLNPELWRGD